MKLFLVGLVALLFVACSSEKEKNKAFTIFYKVDYPLQKNNAFLYSILPKETSLQISDNQVKNVINRANLQNVWLFDCNKKEMEVFYQYGEEAFNVKLNPSDVKEMLDDQVEYNIELTGETKKIIGLNAKKAFATNKQNPSEKLTVWYTEDFALNNPNWYNTFREIPGVLLEYSIEKYGIRMDYSAQKIVEDTSEVISKLSVPQKGNLISYDEYNQKMSKLFESFE